MSEVTPKELLLQSFQYVVEHCSEKALFNWIDSLGYVMWRINHDSADGRTPRDFNVDGELKRLQQFMEIAVDQTTRFGVEEPRLDGEREKELLKRTNPVIFKLVGGRIENDRLYPSQEYKGWYDRWEEWKDGLNDSEWIEEKKRINEEVKELFDQFGKNLNKKSSIFKGNSRSLEEMAKKLTRNF